eukprot:CAMPEP_0116026196 /NCGR_PEP_ID=MMETSP0321-20121206/13659_1 /TAXON_ID=163516 /ORGANISM="Leptocylindrus danicus var. danicus, Strain B650" /LENGTH=242 /DNA_ID=CAMNT_0003498853 /DNA_START=80 /DNA_END=808 /DNA_ORIENTATION=+
MKFAAALFVAMSAGPIHAFTPASSRASIRNHKMATFKSRNTIMYAEQQSSSLNPFQSFIGNLFPTETKEIPEKPKIPDFVCDSDYKLGVVFVAIGAVILGFSAAVEHGSPSILGGVAATLHALLGSLFLVQAYRIRFVFDETSFELKNVDSDSDELNDSGENFVVGGANRWRYDSFVNWEFFPNIDYPILVYFKETQTPEEMWNEGPGEFDKVGGGQIHFFPAIANVQQLKEQFELRECSKV